VICFETCLTSEFVKRTLEKFQKSDKVYYQDGVLWIKNLRKYNQGGPTVQTRIEKDMLEIPHCELKKQYIAYYDPNIPYEYPSDSLLYEMECNELKGNEDSLSVIYAGMLTHWKALFPNKPQPKLTTKSIQDKVRTRFKEPAFVRGWLPAMEKAVENTALHDDSWFTFQWLVKNADNYQKLLDGYYDWKMGGNDRQPQPLTAEEEWKREAAIQDAEIARAKNRKRIQEKE
jgi:hypothetical protein